MLQEVKSALNPRQTLVSLVGGWHNTGTEVCRFSGRPPSTRQEVCPSMPKFSQSGCKTSTVNFSSPSPGTLTSQLLSNISGTTGQMRCRQCGRECLMFHERFSPWKSLSWTEYTYMLCYDMHLSTWMRFQTQRSVDYKLIAQKPSAGQTQVSWVVQLAFPTTARST